jgi:hypothetical protein
MRGPKCCGMVYTRDSQPGVRIPLGVRLRFTRGTQAVSWKLTTEKSTEKSPSSGLSCPKNKTETAVSFAIFLSRGYNLYQSFTWGYAYGYNIDLGVRKYQKVENIFVYRFMNNFILFLLDCSFCIEQWKHRNGQDW